MKKILMIMLLTITILCGCNPSTKVEETALYKKIIDKGDDQDKLVFIILAEGYTKSEISDFEDDALEFANYVLDEPPFNKYRDDINFYIINTISNESGAASDPSQPIDNYFGSTYNLVSGYQRLLGTYDTYIIEEVLKDSQIIYDYAFVVVNSSQYGGSGGKYSFTSLHPDSKEILIHELGHSIALLGDEYYAGDLYTSEAANVTRESDPEKVKWKDLIGINEVGVYPMQGVKGWYIPHLRCKMQVLNQPFCEVCKLELEKYIEKAIKE